MPYSAVDHGNHFSRRAMLTRSAAAGLAGLSSISYLQAIEAQETSRTAIASATSDEIYQIVAAGMETYDLRAVIYSVSVAGKELMTGALGDSMTGLPATPDMHFRNGNVAFPYMTTLLLLFVEDGLITLDDTIDTWIPDLPDANQVTLKMLANMTAGYPDYVQNPVLLDQLLEDPFRHYAAEDLIEIGLSTQRVFTPGSNWDYSHTNYVVLGQALEAIGGASLDILLRERVLDPLGLASTFSSPTAEIPAPVLHAFSSERRGYLGLQPEEKFLEESTFWNPSWTTAPGAVQSTTIKDMTATAIAIGTGELLSEDSFQTQISSALLGFGEPLEGCPSCHTLDDSLVYGLGVMLSGEWIMQTPLFFGYAGVMAYTPEHDIAISVVNTYEEAAFDNDGEYRDGNASRLIFLDIAKYLIPDQSQDIPSRT